MRNRNPLDNPILLAARDLDENVLNDAIRVMLSEDWITNPVLVAEIIRHATENLVAQLGGEIK